MILVMFDIDGTLTSTSEVDADCYVKAVFEVLNIRNIDTDWTNYRNVTDSGVAAEIIERNLGRPAREEELQKIKNRFISLLKGEASSNIQLFRPIAGAQAMLDDLARKEDVRISLAGGAWRESMLIKLRTANLKIEHYPMASSSDATTREEIMKISLKRACAANRVDSFESIVYVGDGVWDLRAAKALGYGFIGVGSQEEGARLKAAGAKYIVRDFLDKEIFFSLLNSFRSA